MTKELMRNKKEELNSPEIIKKMKEINDAYRTFDLKPAKVEKNTDFRQPSLLRYDGLRFFSSTTSQSK